MSLALIFVGVISVLITIICWTFKRQLTYWQKCGIACEEPTFFVGNLNGVTTERSFFDIWQHHYKRFKGTGPFSGFYWFQKPAAFVLDPMLMKHVLIKDFSKFIDRNFFSNEEDDPLTGQIFLLRGHRWTAMRKKLSPTFTSGKMKFMFPIVMDVAHEFIHTLNELIKEDTIVEIKEILARFTTDVIGTCAFGINCNSLKDPEAEFRVIGKQSLNPKRQGRLGLALMASYPELARKLHMATFEDHIQKFFLRIVRENVEQRERNGIRRNDFMDMLIDLKNSKTESITLEEMTAQAFVFFSAGFETSSTTMGFALYELAKRPDIQQRVREEVIKVLEQNNNEFTYECMKEFKYMEQVINETLRLYTVLPILNRECVEDFVVPDNPKYSIKKGMPVVIPIGCVHRDPEYYPNPDVFDPDHFTPERVQERDPMLFQPFGEGPRNCIGMRFGQMQMRIGLALLLKKFKFSVCSQTVIPLELDKTAFLISANSGIYLKVEKI